MFLKNDLMKRYFNGKIGVIKSLEDEEIVVECDGKDIYVVAGNLGKFPVYFKQS